MKRALAVCDNKRAGCRSRTWRVSGRLLYPLDRPPLRAPSRLPPSGLLTALEQVAKTAPASRLGKHENQIYKNNNNKSPATLNLRTSDRKYVFERLGGGS